MKKLSLGRKINSIFVNIVNLAISLVWFGLFFTITYTFLTILFNPFEFFKILMPMYSGTEPLWAKIIITLIVIGIILPTTTFMKSYYSALGDVILFIFRKKKFKEVMYHFDIRRW